MAETVGQHSVAAFTSPVNGTSPIDANTVKGNDNTIRSAYVDHDADPGIHVQSSTLASRPTANSAGRKWMTADSGVIRLFYDDGTNWYEADYLRTTGGTISGNLAVTGTLGVTGVTTLTAQPILSSLTASQAVFTDASKGLVSNAITGTGNVVMSASPTLTGTIQAAAANLSGALGVSGLLTFASLKGTGATTVTNILDEDNMASDSATALATQQSIKAYVDAQVGASDALSEVLAIGNTTGANDIIVSTGQKIRTPAVAAGDGSAAITIANTSGALTFAAALADSNLATISTAGKVANSATTATDANTASAIVARDASGNFSAGTITAALTGNASTATALQTARTINGTSFDGTANITVTAAAGTLTGTTLASNVVSSSLTSVGTLANLTVTNPISGSVTGSSGSTTGNAATATALQTARNINGVSFNGTADITVTAAAGTLTGTTLASGVTASSLTSVGTLTSLTVSGDLTVDTSTLKVDSTNNRVGVGTASPASTLDVRAANASQSIRVTATTGTNPAYFGANNTGGAFYFGLDNSTGTEFGSAYTGAIYLSGAYPITFYTNAVERMRLDASGNLGLGVTPSAWGSGRRVIEVSGSSGNYVSAPNASVLAINSNNYFDGSVTKYSANGHATQYAQSTGQHIWLNAVSGTAGNTVSFTQAMTLDASGYLGIGTTSPDGRIYASETTNGLAYFTFRNPSTGGSAIARLRVGNSGSENAFTIDVHGSSHATLANVTRIFNQFTAPLVLGTDGTERARIDASGNLFVGTTTAQNSANVQISVGSGASSSPRLSVFNTATSPTSSASSAVSLGFVNGSANYVATNTILGAVNFLGQANDDAYGGASIQALVTSGGNVGRGSGHSVDMIFNTKPSTGTGVTERARITSVGTLGVGTTTDGFNGDAGLWLRGNLKVAQFSRSGDPSLNLYRLASNGDIAQFHRDSTLVGSISVTTTATAYNTSSDRRLKENIVPAGEAGDIIDAIQIVQYDWKVGGHTRFGVVAQDEVENVPEAINVGDDGDEIAAMWGVDYSKLVPMLVKEIQSLRARVAALEA